MLAASLLSRSRSCPLTGRSGRLCVRFLGGAEPNMSATLIIATREVLRCIPRPSSSTSVRCAGTGMTSHAWPFTVILSRSSRGLVGDRGPESVDPLVRSVVVLFECSRPLPLDSGWSGKTWTTVGAGLRDNRRSDLDEGSALLEGSALDEGSALFERLAKRL